MEISILQDLWSHLVWPLARIFFFVALGLIVASTIESMKWTDSLAALARPLTRLGNLSPIIGASFSMAFISGVSANTMLSEALAAGSLSKKELVLANLFNSLPRYFLHLPTIFFLTFSLIQTAALIYICITFVAAILQTIGVIVASRLLLAATVATDSPVPPRKRPTLPEALRRSLARLRRRIPRIALFLIPAYVLFFILGRIGIFDRLQALFASTWLLSWLAPQSLGIVILHVSAEFSAGLAAASAMLADNSLSSRDVVLALLAGNIISTPIRALRHQLPYYMGIFPRSLAIELVAISQITRSFCVILAGACYYYVSLP